MVLAALKLYRMSPCMQALLNLLETNPAVGTFSVVCSRLAYNIYLHHFSMFISQNVFYFIFSIHTLEMAHYVNCCNITFRKRELLALAMLFYRHLVRLVQCYSVTRLYDSYNAILSPACTTRTMLFCRQLVRLVTFKKQR